MKETRHVNQVMFGLVEGKNNKDNWGRQTDDVKHWCGKDL